MFALTVTSKYEIWSCRLKLDPFIGFSIFYIKPENKWLKIDYINLIIYVKRTMWKPSINLHYHAIKPYTGTLM